MVRIANHPAKALVARWFDFSEPSRSEFRKWYAHSPRAGWGDRFEAVEGEPSDLAVLESDDDIGVSGEVEMPPGFTGSEVKAETRAYRLQFSTAPGSDKRLTAPFFLVSRLSVAPGQEEVFREWLQKEHGFRQTAVPGVRSYHGYEPVDGAFHFLNFFGIDDPSIVSSDPWEAARETEWRHRAHKVVTARRRAVYRRVG